MFTIPSFQNSNSNPAQGIASGSGFKPRFNQPPAFGLQQAKHPASAKQQHFELFNSLLQKAYQRLADNARLPEQANANLPQQAINPGLKPEYAGFAPVDKITSQQAADNILGFIERKLRSDLADGADKAQLTKRLEQGLQGFIKGFNEAKDTIQSLGLLTPELEKDIGETFQKVTDGIEQFRNKIDQHFAGGSTDPVAANSANVTASRLQVSSAQTASFSLELVTQDGDKVTIDIAKSSQISASAGYKQSEDGSVFQLKQQQSSASTFQLTVQGNLDDEELAAIDQVLQDVDDIATNFYQGNLDAAFASASALDINRDQLSSLDLELQKTTVSKALASYTTNSQQANNSSPLVDLNQLVNDVTQAVDQLQNFTSPFDIFDQIVQGVDLLQSSQSQEALPAAENNSSFADSIRGLLKQFEILPVENPNPPVEDLPVENPPAD